MKKILLLLILFSAGTLVTMESCSKSAYFDATVVQDANGGDCEWMLNIDGSVYYPQGLRGQDLVDGKVITIQYTISAIPYKCESGIERPVASITKFL